MYSKISTSQKKRQILNFDDEPPDKKITSDGDILIKQLAEKQRNTKVILEEQLNAKNRFYKSTEVNSITNYTSGSLTLEKFNSVLHYVDNVEKLKACGLTNAEIELLNDYRKGQQSIKNSHKNLNNDILEEQINAILGKIKQNEQKSSKQDIKLSRLKAETSLATKPTSIETKLLKFALENEGNPSRLPGPMDQIKDVEAQLLKDLAPVDIKKIRKKARSLSKQIEDLNNAVIREPNLKRAEPSHFCSTSKWDLREIPKTQASEPKVYTCKPQNYYTIRGGEVMKLGDSGQKSTAEIAVTKLSVAEIKKIPKFENYEKGEPSRVLYLKNLASGIEESDLKRVFGNFSSLIKFVNIMKGRMRGQAFVEFEDEETAEKVLDLCNGTILKNKPIIIQFGKKK